MPLDAYSTHVPPSVCYLHSQVPSYLPISARAVVLWLLGSSTRVHRRPGIQEALKAGFHLNVLVLRIDGGHLPRGTEQQLCTAFVAFTSGAQLVAGQVGLFSPRAHLQPRCPYPHPVVKWLPLVHYFLVAQPCCRGAWCSMQHVCSSMQHVCSSVHQGRAGQRRAMQHAGLI